MPSMLEAPPKTEAPNPFGDLIPKDLIGGENGAPAYQTVGGRFGAVPKAEVNAPTGLGAFADLVPSSPTSETEKALAETPQPESDLTKLEKGLGDIAPPLIGLHEILNAARVLANGAGRYIFRGLEGGTHYAGKTMGDAPTVEEGAVSASPEHQQKLEELYHSDVADAFGSLPAQVQQKMGIDPALAKTAPARIADAAGPAVVASLEALIPGIGLPLMATHGAMTTEAEAKAAGASDADAEAAGARSAIGLSLFGGASKLASLGVSKALPYLANNPGKFAQFLTQFVGQEAANEASSRAINAWEAASSAPEGKKIEAAINALGDQNLEGGTFNVVYALMHASHAAGQPNKGATERATSPASEPVPAPATTTGPAPEVPQSAKPAPPVMPRDAARAEWTDQIRQGEPDPAIPLVSEQGAPALITNAEAGDGGVELTHLDAHGEAAPEWHPTFDSALKAAARDGLRLDDNTPEGQSLSREAAPAAGPENLAPTQEASAPAQTSAAPLVAADLATSGGIAGRGIGRVAEPGSRRSGSGPELTAETPERQLLRKLSPRPIKGDGGFAEHPLVQFIQGDMGGIRSKSAAREKLGKEKFAANKSLWDDAPNFPDPRQNKVYNARSGQLPDAVAQAAADAGLLPHGADATTLNSALQKIADSSHRIAKQERIRAKEEGYAVSKQGPREMGAYAGGNESPGRPGESKGMGQGEQRLAAARARVEETGSTSAKIVSEHPDWSIPEGDVKTPGQLADEKAAHDAEMVRLQQAQDVRVGAAKPLRAGEDIRPAADMFAMEAQPELLGPKPAGIKERIRAASEMMQDVVNESRKQGLVPPGSAGVQGGIEHLGKIWRQIRDLPKFGDFKKAILRFGQKMQSSFLEAKEIQRTIKRAVPSKAAREGIMAYIEANGDKATLTTWRDASPEKDLRRGYDAALNLTPEQIAVADHLRDFYSSKLAEGQAAGILAEGRENYVNRIVDKRRSKGFAPVTAGGSGVGPGSGGRLSKNFRHGLHRVFENSFDAERNGIRYKTKDVAELAPIYLTEMNKTIGTRNLLADLAHGTAEDGRALAYPKGVMSTLTDAQGDVTSRLIKPNAKQMVVDEMTGQDVSSHDYRSVEHPALEGWKWVGADSEGKPILLQGNLALHPEIAGHVKNLLGESALRRWYNSDGSPLASLPKALIRNIDKAQQVAKELLFSGSGFHHANIGFHAVEHRVNPLPEFFKSLSRDYTIDPHSPKVQDWMQHSLQLAPDQLSARHFMEGFSGRAVQKIPLYGRIAGAVADHLFERFIPALKLRLADSMLARNMKLYAGDIAANRVTPEQVKYLSAQQANSALSHLNYIDIGRNPTLQHLISLGTLAPDFSESRARFLSQAAKTLLGSKAGVEQFQALAFGAGLIWTMARVLNKVSDDDYHFDQPFGVVHNGRVYNIRSIQGDVAHLITDPQKFTYGRVSPLVKLGLEQFVTGTNYRGEKIGHMESLKEYLANYVPISFKNVPGLRDLFETTKNNPVTPWESFMGAMGIQASRYSPITNAYKLARDYQKEQGIAPDTGAYPVSKYQQLRYALEDGDLGRARTEYQKLLDAGEKRTKLTEGFKQSLMHPFTGSQTSDLKFKKSLGGDDRAMYDAAVQKRHDILRRYHAMRAGG